MKDVTLYHFGVLTSNVHMIWKLKQSDKKAVENHIKGCVWEFDYEKMFSTLILNPVCEKVCRKNKYTSWVHLISRYCTEEC